MAAANRKTHAATRPRLVFACALVAFASGLAGAAEPVDFGRDILPIFSNNCYHGHGPDEQERKAKLRLDTREGVLSAGKSGAIAVITAARFGRPTRVSVRSCSFRGHSRPWPTRHARAIQRGEDPIRFS